MAVGVGGEGGGGNRMDVMSVAMYWMGMYALLERFLPPPLQQWLSRKMDALWQWLLHHEAPDTVTLRIPERSDECINHVYRHSVLYISSLDNALCNHKSLDVVRVHEGDPLRFHLPLGVILEDTFHGVVVQWKKMKEDSNGGSGRYGGGGNPRGGGGGYGAGGRGRTNGRGSDNEYFTLEFPASGRSAIVPGYLEHVTRTAMEIQHKNTQLKICSNSKFRNGHWESAPFTHPSTFDSIALDTDLHSKLLDDLDSFRENQDLYRHLGRAWKRGYLLHGPPGTGKSSLIAAIANRLHYDIYDLELTNVWDNAELKKLLMSTTRRSIIVIEDIDCSFQFADRRSNVINGPESNGNNTMETSTTNNSHGITATDPTASKLTLSGLLNFTDGLWSGCAEERIFIFTTNFKERLDPALLRPGRMDMHIHLSYCTPAVVEKLAVNYLDGTSRETHPELFIELEEVACGQNTVTPATMAETFIRYRGGGNPEAMLKAVIEEIRTSADTLKTGAGTNQWEMSYRKQEKKGIPRTIHLM